MLKHVYLIDSIIFMFTNLILRLPSFRYFLNYLVCNKIMQNCFNIDITRYYILISQCFLLSFLSDLVA